jgi:pyruvate,orthophosphate dikinase
MPERRKHAGALPSPWDLAVSGTIPNPGEVGFKAHNLMRMAALGLPVPSGFVLPTAWCRAELEDALATATLEDQLRGRIARLEAASGLGFGHARRPLLVSVRSGAPVSMPGMMDTVLNVGLSNATLGGFLRVTGDHRLVWDSYRRLLESFATVVAGQDASAYAAILADSLERHGAESPAQLDFRAMRQLCGDYLVLYRNLGKRDFPQAPLAQLALAARAVFRSWNSERARAYRRMHDIDDRLGTAVTVQRMVFGNAGAGSGAGVAFTRDPSSGENRLYVDWLGNAQGEDIVSGRRTLASTPLPAAVETRLREISAILEREFRDAQELEFTVEQGVLHLLQTRAAKRTPLAALRIAVEQAEEGLISAAEVAPRLREIDVEGIVLRRARTRAPPLARAVSASLGVASGPIALDAEAAGRYAAAGTPPVLVRAETATEDIAGIAVAAGLLTGSGGRTSHAAVVARQMGVVTLVGCPGLMVDGSARSLRLGEHLLQEGDLLCLDGETGAIYAEAPRIHVEKPLDLLRRLRGLVGDGRNAPS